MRTVGALFALVLSSCSLAKDETPLVEQCEDFSTYKSGALPAGRWFLSSTGSGPMWAIADGDLVASAASSPSFVIDHLPGSQRFTNCRVEAEWTPGSNATSAKTCVIGHSQNDDSATNYRACLDTTMAGPGLTLFDGDVLLAQKNFVYAAGVPYRLTLTFDLGGALKGEVVALDGSGAMAEADAHYSDPPSGDIGLFALSPTNPTRFHRLCVKAL